MGTRSKKGPRRKLPTDAKGMVSVEDLADSEGVGYGRIKVMHGATFKDPSTVVVIPTRGLINHRVISSWDNLITPMNGRRFKIFAVGDEVGIAYNNMIQTILAHPELSKWKYLLTLEDDNIVPPDAHVRLLESIEHFDAVGGIYFTKGDINMPMAYGNPLDYVQRRSVRPRRCGPRRDTASRSPRVLTAHPRATRPAAGHVRRPTARGGRRLRVQTPRRARSPGRQATPTQRGLRCVTGATGCHGTTSIRRPQSRASE
jgi:hypothetical protein